MNMMNPAAVASARTARLVREAVTPVYSTSTESVRQGIIAAAEDYCGPDYCHVCRRATEHYGEHTDEQLFAWAMSARGRCLMGA